ncbi:MAG: DUF2807 domain-containing protein [Clostridiales bacterium]|nr:DUF2807 domain-containing protein [Clostridiales bacterium]
MKKALASLAALIAAAGTALSGCITFGVVIGNGRMVSGEYAYKGVVKRIEIEKVSATVHITNKNDDKVTYKIDENLEDSMKIEYNDGVLKISASGMKSLGVGANIAFYVGTDALENVNISGDAVIEGIGVFEGRRMGFDISGAAKINMEIDVDETALSASGAADITLSGRTGSLSIRNSGAATINARDLKADSAKLNVSGACFVQVSAEETLDVTLSGAGAVTYWGDPAVTRKISGLGTVNQGE